MLTFRHSLPMAQGGGGTQSVSSIVSYSHNVNIVGGFTEATATFNITPQDVGGFC